MRCFLHAKIHKAVVTQADLNYVGSITIDKELLDLIDIKEGERVQITDNTNGSRIETYVIPGDKGQICMNGAAAHLVNPGDEIIIMAYE